MSKNIPKQVYWCPKRSSGKKRERERERERDWTDRQTDRQTDRHKESPPSPSPVAVILTVLHAKENYDHVHNPLYNVKNNSVNKKEKKTELVFKAWLNWLFIENENENFILQKQNPAINFSWQRLMIVTFYLYVLFLKRPDLVQA